jgi:uncharacterized membrane protein SpoIIM required for sporulation
LSFVSSLVFIISIFSIEDTNQTLSEKRGKQGRKINSLLEVSPFHNNLTIFFIWIKSVFGIAVAVVVAVGKK